MTKLRHYDNLGTARFITFCCYHRYQLLNETLAKKSFIRNLIKIREKYNIKLYGYALMPEHVHLVLYPPDDLRLGKVIGQLKALTSREMLAYMRNRQSGLLEKLRVVRGGREICTFWQRRCYDHNCRTSEIVNEKIEYCHKNPVVRGLVKSPEDWIWSSYNYYLGNDDVPIRMDDIE